MLWVALFFVVQFDGIAVAVFLDHPSTPANAYASFTTKERCEKQNVQRMARLTEPQKATVTLIEMKCVQVQKDVFERTQGYRLRDYDDRSNV